MRYNLLIISAITLLMVSCKSQKEEKKPEKKEGVTIKKEEKLDKFNLEEIEGTYQIYYMEEMPDINENKPYVILQKSGNVSGVNGCNTFYGRTLPSSEENVFDKLGSTRMACDGEKGDIERIFMKTMKRITNIRLLTEETIEFLAGDVSVMKGKRIKLQGDYRIISFKGKDIKSLGMTFNVDGIRYNGTTGCNTFSGQMEQLGFNSKFTELAATEMACENFDTKFESEFLSILQAINRFTFEENIYSFYEGDKVIFKAIKE